MSPALHDGVVFLDRYTDDDIPAHLGPAYESLDARFEGLAIAERSLFEGSS